MEILACFADHAELAALEDAVRQTSPTPAILIALAWYLRQSAPLRAQMLAREARSLLPPCTTLQHLRLQLLDAEHAWLQAELPQATQLLQHILRHLQEGREAQDAQALTLLADTHVCAALIANEDGRDADSCRHWQAAIDAARSCDDQMRLQIAELGLYTRAVFRSPRESANQAVRWMALRLEQQHPALRAVLSHALGLQLHLSTDMVLAIHYYSECHQASLASGQIRRACLAAVNASRVFLNLHDVDGALVWTERALQLVRPLGWPAPLGSALVEYASALQLLGRLPEAQQVIEEALQVLHMLPHSRNYLQGLMQQGNIALAQRDADAALHSFSRLQELAGRLQQHDYLSSAPLGIARALILHGRYEEARSTALHGLSGAEDKQDFLNQLDLLEALAQIHRALQQFPQQLVYLQQALQLAQSIEGLRIPHTLHEALAELHAQQGEFALAYSHGQLALAARDAQQHEAAAKRAQAIQAWREAERQRAEGEQLRAQAQAERARAQALQDSNIALQHLAAIGREITAQRDIDQLYSTLHSHLQSLLDAHYCALLLLDADGHGLHSVLRVEGGTRLPPCHLQAQDDCNWPQRCLDEQREILLCPYGDQPAACAPCTMASALYGPLTLGARQLGVLTIQSRAPHAYGERELLIFRNLCAYGAIALDNAQAWQALQQTQKQLVEQEKLAALGSLVTGVAHELNTPLGNGLVMASSLRDRFQQMQGALQARHLSLQKLEQFVSEGEESAQMLMQALQSAARLVRDFKQISVHQHNTPASQFDLLQATQEALMPLAPALQGGGHSLQLEIADGLLLCSHQQAYSRVVQTLIGNALAHAFGERNPGRIRIRAACHKPGWLRLQFCDNGCGIPAQDLKHIFDPFFTTRLGHGGSGLGLSICYNLVTSLLGGSISAHSEMGQGCLFEVLLPVQAPG